MQSSVKSSAYQVFHLALGSKFLNLKKTKNNKKKNLPNFVIIPTETHILCVPTFLKLFSHSEPMHIVRNAWIHVRKLYKLLSEKDMYPSCIPLNSFSGLGTFSKVTKSSNFQVGVKGLLSLKIHVKLTSPNQVWNQSMKKSVPISHLTSPLNFTLP